MVNGHQRPSPANLPAEILSKKSRSKRQPVALPVKFQPRFWEDADRRIATVRAVKARYLRLREDAGGGESYQRDLLIQRAVFLSIMLETIEVRASEGGDFEVGVYTQASNTLMGLLKTLGLEKQIKSVTDLKAYVESRNDNPRSHQRR
jgi:hypothetical protein